MTVIEKCEMCGAKVIDGALAPSEREMLLEEALKAILRLEHAYPLKVFPEPDFEKCRQLLEAGGESLDRVSASNMRHAVGVCSKIVRAALDAK